jgi:hypothetical protein
MTTTSGTIACNSVWRLHCDLRQRKYVLTIEFCSNLPPARHEEIHRLLRDQALEWLTARRIPPERCRLHIHAHRTEDQPCRCGANKQVRPVEEVLEEPAREHEKLEEA